MAATNQHLRREPPPRATPPPPIVFSATSGAPRPATAGASKPATPGAPKPAAPGARRPGFAPAVKLVPPLSRTLAPATASAPEWLTFLRAAVPIVVVCFTLGLLFGGRLLG